MFCLDVFSFGYNFVEEAEIEKVDFQASLDVI